MRLLFISIFVVLFIFNESKAQDDFIEKSELTWYSLKDAQSMALENSKKVLIFGDAVWCTFCKKMKKEVYPESGVINIIEEHFYPVLLDSESNKVIEFNGNEFTEMELARAFRMSGTPTHYFLDSDGSVLGQQPGFIPADIFERLLSFIGTNSFKNIEFSEYEYKGSKLSDEEGE